MIYFVLFLCGSKIPKHFNKLFSDHKHSQRLYCMLRLGKRSICPFEEQVSPTKRKTINEKHQEGRRRVKEWICKTGEQRTFYFLGINIYTNIDSTNGGPFLRFIILFSLSGQDDAKQTQNETGNKATIYATLPTH